MQPATTTDPAYEPCAHFAPMLTAQGDLKCLDCGVVFNVPAYAVPGTRFPTMQQMRKETGP